MNQEEALEILNRVGAVVTGSHLVYTSGLHGSVYVAKDKISVDDTALSLICEAIAWQFRNDGVEVVVAPAVGGIKFSARVAHRLAKLTGRKVPGVYAERDEKSILKAEHDMTFVLDDVEITIKKGDELVVRKPNFILKRGYGEVVRGKKVLVVEDVLTTGGSARKVVEATRAFGGEVIGVGVICNRGGITPQELGNSPKLFALVNLTLKTYDEADCPLCRDGVPQVRPERHRLVHPHNAEHHQTEEGRRGQGDHADFLFVQKMIYKINLILLLNLFLGIKKEASFFTLSFLRLYI